MYWHKNLYFLWQISQWQNAAYGEFSEALSSIGRKGMTVDLVEPLPLFSFISMNLVNFYTYNGSLTTPPCSEKVIWIDYMLPIDISEYQV